MQKDVKTGSSCTEAIRLFFQLFAIAFQLNWSDYNVSKTLQKIIKSY